MKFNTSFPLTFSLLLLIQCTTTTLAQPAAAPAPAAPTNVTKILEKAGQYTTLIRLLKITQVGDQINTQLNNSNQGMTIFAPTDNAFSALKSGTLNSLTDQEKVELIQFHVLPTVLSTSQFQTVSNPLRTQAGNSAGGQFPLNVTTSGNSVNITTGVTNATVANTVYTDSTLAVYQVDNVLLPLAMFGPKAPAPAPGVAKKPKKKSGDADSPSSDDGTADASASSGLTAKSLLVGIISLVAGFCL
ncbi:fasciclin-like arabinogalactan protein 11 [Apium graveolens]|uniref:fasciclin-like arabinogalactan protein 11 n=1 Tax=Apium graveolens TaxID=4045 RepID=UPI003D79ED87